MKRKKIIINYIFPLISVGTVLFLWWLASELNPTLAGPVDTIKRFFELLEKPLMNKSLLEHVWASFRRIFVSFIVACIVGISLGVLFGIFPTFRRIFYPVFQILRPIPPLAWIPIVVLWAGVSTDLSKDILIFIGIVMAIVINTYEGIRNTDELLLNVGKILGANKRQILFDILIPSIMPSIFAGMKTGLSTGWMSLVAAEMIAAKEGIGFIINMSMSGVPDTALDFIGIILVAISSVLMTWILVLLERRLCPWLKLKEN